MVESTQTDRRRPIDYKRNIFIIIRISKFDKVRNFLSEH